MTNTERPADGHEEVRSVGFGELIRPIRGKLVAACIVQAFASIAALVPFVAVAELGRELLGDGPVDDGRLWAIAWVAIAGVVTRIVLLFVASSITHFADNDLQLDLRRRLADRLGRAPLGWFDDRDGGDIKKAVVDDVGAMHHVVGHTFTDLTSAVVAPIAAMIYLFTIDWRLSLIVLVPFLIGVALYSRQFAGYRDKMEDYNRSLEEINVASVEFVQGISVVKTFGESGRAHRRFAKAANEFVDYFWNWVSGMLRISSASEIVLSPLMTLTVIAAAGTWFVSNGWISAVDLVLFFLLGLVMTAPILQLGYAMTDLQTASDAAARVGVLLATPTLTEVADPQRPEGNAVQFDSVSFSYDGRRTVLDDVTLHLQPGTVTALVGPSGSGKSTLAKLLCRFWDPTAGAVRIGGVDLRNIASDELYRHVGFVFQDVQLLRASIAENIALGRPGASRDDVIAAAQAAQIHERIEQFPNGYDTVVDEGAKLSGGEAQRVSIARALLADAPILVLDEATAFADPESEAAIQDALSNLAVGRTLLVIAHRLSTIVEADQIAVVDQGHVVELGRHGDLLDLDGLYAGQWAADQRAEPTIDSTSNRTEEVAR